MSFQHRAAPSRAGWLFSKPGHLSCPFELLIWGVGASKPKGQIWICNCSCAFARSAQCKESQEEATCVLVEGQGGGLEV